MSIINFTDLDFDQIKTSIKDYLRSNSNFTDYDFEGSNLSIMIDILAYNTYISSYNANMMSNEVFIDSATLRENVVALARNIGYVPKSKTCASAKITFSVDVANFESNFPVNVTLKAGEVCNSTGSGYNGYIFSIPSDVTVSVVDNIATFDNITIYEGSFIKEYYTVDSFDLNRRYILDNPNIDTKTIRVKVRPSQTSTIVNEYTLANSLIEIEQNPRVYFIQEIEDQRYEIFFGDGIFGQKLENGNYIEISYIVTNGDESNGVNSFNFIGNLVTNNNISLTKNISLITTTSVSRGGSDIESIDSIKKYAPKIYASQNRAVTAKDYESIIPMLYPETESISVFGGEELSPPQYGKVFITIKPINANFVSESIKDNLKRELRKYSVAGIVPEFLDLKYLYLEVYSSIYYNSNLVANSEEVQKTVLENITKYAKSSELNKYGSRFKYSKFLKIIDDSHKSITSNITSVLMRRDIKPSLNSIANYEICFGNSFHIKNHNGYNIKSSGFKLSDIADTVYFSDIPDSTGKTGSIFVFKLDFENNPIVLKTKLGKIDYEKGEIIVNALNIISSSKTKNDEPIIEISVSPKSNDVIGKQDLYLQLDYDNISLSVISDGIESGFDVSGSTFTTSSSYLNGSPIRK
jgi:hypothetical protein